MTVTTVASDCCRAVFSLLTVSRSMRFSGDSEDDAGSGIGAAGGGSGGGPWA